MIQHKTKNELLIDKAQETFCKAAILELRRQELDIYHGNRVPFIHESIDIKRTQTVFTEFLRRRALHLSNHPPISENVGQH